VQKVLDISHMSSSYTRNNMIELFQIHSFICDVIVKHKFVFELPIPISPSLARIKIDE
jgi:hypothetical protein